MQQHISEHSFETQRFHMIEGQLKPNGILNPDILRTFLTVAREEFVPATHKKHAYLESKIELSSTRYLMEPMNLAKLLQSAKPQKTDKVLVIGSATGYSSAILSHLTAHVHALETETSLKKITLQNVCVHEGPLQEGVPQHGPYDIILIDGAIAELPMAISAQLNDGGRLVTLLHVKNQFCQGTLFLKNGKNLSSQALFETEGTILPGFEKAKSFSFAA